MTDVDPTPASTPSQAAESAAADASVAGTATGSGVHVQSIRDLLTEFDDITLSLTADGHIRLSARNATIAEVDDLGDVPTALSDPDLPRRLLDQFKDDRHRFAPRELRGTIVKAANDVDLYCAWSGGVDNVIAVGTRQQMLNEGVSPSRMARADRYGTSAIEYGMPATYPCPYRSHGWDDQHPGMLVREQDGAPRHGEGWLPRTRLVEFLTAKAEGRETDAGALLDPLED